MSVRNVRSALEGFSGFLVVPKLHVVDEAEVVIESPVIGIVLNAIFHQLNRALGLAGAVRWLGRKKAGSKFVCDQQMRIQMSGNFKQRRQQVVAGREGMMPRAKVLHGASPVNTGQQTVITETGALDHLRRTQEENFIERGLRAE